MKILWQSTAPWGPSSYSVLTKRTVPELVRLGWTDILIHTWYGLQGASQTWNIRPRGEPKADPIAQVKVLPAVTTGDYGNATILSAYQMSQRDLCITCQDLWVMPPQLLGQMKVAAWLPVDHDPCPVNIAASAKACVYAMSFSKWGQRVLQDAGVDAHYVPCSADSSVYLPLDRATAKEKLNLPPDCQFLVSMVAANKDPSDRKGFGEALQGFARFAARHEGAYLYIHSHWGGPINIEHLVERLGLANRVIQPNQTAYLFGLIDDDYMRLVYSASDVLLNPAKSEGFGLPVVEAQLCGCPVALTSFSTTDELLFAGWKIAGQLNWSIGADSWRLLAYIDSVTEALEDAYAERGNETLRQQARRGAVAYDSERVAKEHWRPAMTEIERLVSHQNSELKLVTF